MPTLTLNIKTAIRPNQVLSSYELKSKFLFGLPLTSQRDGTEIPDETIDFYIQSAVTMMEGYLGVKLSKQVIEEQRDFNGDDWRQWGFVKMTYPIVCPLKLDGYLGSTKQIGYPPQWLSVHKTNDGHTYSRQMNIVPTQNAQHSELVIYSGLMPQTGMIGSYGQIPNYWTARYVTGYNQIPADIMQAIGMFAAMPILGILGDIMMPWPGISSRSVSIDSISQSTSSFVNGQSGAFGARLKQYNDTLFNPQTGGLMASLRDYYGAIIWGVA